MSVPETTDTIRATKNYPRTTRMFVPRPSEGALRPDDIRHAMRRLGITENIVLYEQDYEQFLLEKGMTELGRGAEGVVYFLRGHVVKVSQGDAVPSALREIAHMLHLNRNIMRGAMGERARDDFPSLLWVYLHSNGGLSIGMKPFEQGDDDTAPGSTLHDRLNVGPLMSAAHVALTIRGLAESLAYAHTHGIIHHDLKPANIFIPARASQRPVLFDFGQALWQHAAWGRNWLLHMHNAYYWYNGTYRYMHHPRRLAHLAALAKAKLEEPTPEQAEAFQQYTPAFYDDIQAYARILHDFARSQFVAISEEERLELTDFYRRIMRFGALVRDRNESGFLRMFKSIRGDSSAQPAIWGDPRHVTMGALLQDIDRMLARFHTE
jgi:serine/threonine protein kinase